MVQKACISISKGSSKEYHKIHLIKFLMIFSSNVLPLHWTGTPGILQARGREMAKDRLMGIWKGTLPVTMRHRQSRPPLARDLRELQQSALGEVPFAVLFVNKFMQGVKLEMMEALHGVLIWP